MNFLWIGIFLLSHFSQIIDFFFFCFWIFIFNHFCFYFVFVVLFILVLFSVILCAFSFRISLGFVRNLFFFLLCWKFGFWLFLIIFNITFIPSDYCVLSLSVFRKEEKKFFVFLRVQHCEHCNYWFFILSLK